MKLILVTFIGLIGVASVGCSGSGSDYSSDSDYNSDSDSNSSFDYLDTPSNPQTSSSLNSSNQRQGSLPEIWTGTQVSFMYTEGYPPITTGYCGIVKKVDSTSYDIEVTTQTTTGPIPRILYKVPSSSVVKGC